MTTTIRFFVSLATIFNRSLAILLPLLMCFWAPLTVASDPAANGDTPVGKVSLVLGKAFLGTADQGRQLIQLGTEIRVGDQIFTEANGHVHIRFVDDALVSVRPGSRLMIERYAFNSRHPERSSVKFNLVEGVARSISGKAATAARQRFRLNTPIAAIGVRGTDFVVSVNSQAVRARVNVGIIVLAPFSSECTADSFGPCASNALELASNSMQLIELDSEVPLPRLLPAPEVRDPGMMREEVELAIAGAEENGVDSAVDRTASNEVFQEGVAATKVVTAEAALAVTVAPTPTPTPTPPTPPTPPIDITDVPPAVEPPAPVSPDFTPATAVSAANLSNKQLVWGRFNLGQGQLERITLDWKEAIAERSVTVGNFDYALFRPANDGQGLEPGLGVVSFSLSSAQAFYNHGNGVVAMQVSDGRLDIDFQETSFATELNLNHSLTGSVDIIAAGRLTRDGFFGANSDTQKLFGSVSLDGKEAGYFFDRQLDSGSVQGLTLWDSQ